MKRIKVLRIKAHCYPEIVRIPLGLDSLQKEVGGPIQAVYPWDDPVALICNEEGKLDSDAGHNGLKNIAQLLNTQEYSRLRFGIGSDFPRGGQIDYVLGKFPPEELQLMPEILDRATEIIKSFCLAGIQITMNQFNNK